MQYLLRNIKRLFFLFYFCANIGSMNTDNEMNLKKLLSIIPNNVVITSKYLTTLGVSHDLQKSYERNGWLNRLSQGAYSKLDENFNVEGAVFALQNQLNLSIHIGANTALNNFYGITHNIAFENKQQLFGYRGEKLPKWFKNLYDNSIEFNRTTFLPQNLGIVDYNVGNFNIKIPTLERAILEMFYLVPDKFTANEAYQLMELLTTVKPKEFQKLLENCSSIKVKRLFLYIAETIGHSWFKRLDLTKIDLGKGAREITKGGSHNSKYNIIIGNVEEI